MGAYVFLYELTPEASEPLNRAGADAAAGSSTGSEGVVTVLRAINERLPGDFARMLQERMNYFTELKEKGVLKRGGPFSGFKSGMFVFEAGSQKEAQSIVENDPFHRYQLIREDYALKEWYELF